MAFSTPEVFLRIEYEMPDYKKGLLHLQLGNKLVLFYLLDTVKEEERMQGLAGELGFNGDTLPQI